MKLAWRISTSLAFALLHEAENRARRTAAHWREEWRFIGQVCDEARRASQ